MTYKTSYIFFFFYIPDLVACNLVDDKNACDH